MDPMKIEGTLDTEVAVLTGRALIRQSRWPDDDQVVQLSREQVVLVIAELQRLLNEKDWSGGE